MKLDYGRTFILGLGFFAISLSWALYNAFVPVFLDGLLADVAYKSTLIGIILTFDNIAAITLQPYFGAKSDRTWNAHGRRMPYILVGMPLGALFLALIPVFRSSFLAMITTLVLMNISMAVFRAPTVALMPDITPSPLRSKANGVINLMGGLGALLAFFIGSLLYRANKGFPFYFAAVLMILSTVALRLWIKETPAVEGTEKGDEAVGILGALREVFSDEDRSARAMLLAIFFWFVAWAGIEAFFTLYGKSVWGISEASAAFYLGFFSLALVLSSIPAGILATSIGRGRTIKIGIVGLAASLAALGFIGSGVKGVSIIVPAILVVAGIFWACININSYPMVVDMASRSKTGAYTGLYYLFSSMAAITGPPLFGLLKDILGAGSLFPFAVLCTLAALFSIGMVRKGDPIPAGEKMAQ
ncbi:MAG: MFS transporter [Clostridia bacterium]|nr:MFS transporter [Clostridia bacterium]